MSDFEDWLAQALVGSRRKTASSRAAREKPESSPYFGVPVEDWSAVTRNLLAEHPLTGPDVVSCVLDAWQLMLTDPMPGGLHIGQDIFPNAQTMGLLLHGIVPRLIAERYDGWRPEQTSADTDVVYLPDPRFNTEIKTSSHRTQVFGNRSYGQEDTGRGKKAKSAYYIAVNFEAWAEVNGRAPEVRLIRFGWLDHTDWIGQAAATGQQSSLPQDVENNQLLVVYQR